MRSVDIRLSENGVGHIYSRGVRRRPIPAAHSHRSPVTLTPGGGAASSGTKNVGASGSLASTRYFSKLVMPSAARKVSSIRKLPVKLREGFMKDETRRVRHDFRRARHPHDPLAAEQVFD